MLAALGQSGYVWGGVLECPWPENAATFPIRTRAALRQRNRHSFSCIMPSDKQHNIYLT